MNKDSFNSKWFRKLSWKAKLPIIVGPGFIVFSLPVIFGVNPSMHESGFSGLYFFVNLPAFLAFYFSGLYNVIEKLERYLFGKFPNRYQSSLLYVVCCFLFWLSVSYVIGIIVDVRKKKHHKTE